MQSKGAIFLKFLKKIFGAFSLILSPVTFIGHQLAGISNTMLITDTKR